jgi:hypothetical protein
MNAFETILTEELEALKGTIIANMEAAGQVASRRTIESMKVVVSEEEGTLYGGLPDGAPIGTFETGRGPGGVPAGFPAIILQWMDDKGIHAEPIPYKRQPSDKWQPKYDPQTRGNMAMAGAIAHTIETQGTKLHRDGGRADIYSPAIAEAVDRIGYRLLGIISTEIEHINLNL